MTEPVLKFLSFPGKIHLINTDQELQALTVELESHKEFGFDTETRPSFKKGESHPVALLQLATETEGLRHTKGVFPIPNLYSSRGLRSNSPIMSPYIALLAPTGAKRDLVSQGDNGRHDLT